MVQLTEHIGELYQLVSPIQTSDLRLQTSDLGNSGWEVQLDVGVAYSAALVNRRRTITALLGCGDKPPLSF